MKKVAIILQDERDAFASITLKEDFYESRNTHPEPYIGSTERT
jgi:hypothetical protein